mmetsp:Transcript_48511/g.105721  ORF Transcript_48511/g.105721 Transcript_48511/m.105721 type:complete len:91 (-) Transcript_48511:15-287(-)
MMNNELAPLEFNAIFKQMAYCTRLQKLVFNDNKIKRSDQMEYYEENCEIFKDIVKKNPDLKHLSLGDCLAGDPFVCKMLLALTDANVKLR